MTLELVLTPDLAERLKKEAERQRLPTDQLMLQLLNRHLPVSDRSAGLAELLRSWMESDDDGEQQETGAYLVQVLDEDRLSDRKLFPPELKGKAW